ncbi:MAG: ComEA family DNA-binding protein, partial [Saprospiraceae bacterium]
MSNLKVRSMLRLLIFFLIITVSLQAQNPDSLAVDPPDELQQLIEDFLQNTDSEGAFDFNTIFERLEDFRNDPINLNKANEAILRDLGLLSDAQILDLLAYRQLAGDLISIYELQAIPSFDLPTIRRILPFVTVRGSLDDYQIPLSEMLQNGRDEVFMRWSRILEPQKGFSSSASSPYLGDPNQLYMRYRHAYGTRLSYGITAEKDRGEEFFKGSNRQGFDFYSGHLFIRDLNKTLKAIALGDYSVSIGQGLMVYTGFGIGKSGSPLVLKRTGRVLNPYTSANEVNFFRGAAATISLSKSLEITTFTSFRKRDANLGSAADTVISDSDIRVFTAFDLDGLHRTPGEIADEKVLNQTTLGASIKWKNNFSHLAINGLYDRFDKILQRRLQPYNQFAFNDDRLLNISVDYSFLWRNFNFFGETAMSDNGAIATLNSVLMSLDRTVDFAIVHRHFPRHYQALNANPFAETTGAANENGLYLGLEMRPVKNWILSAYFDAWQHPWLRFQVDAPSRGWEYRARLSYEMRRRLRAYVEVREEVKERNAPDAEHKVNILVENRIFQARLHVENQ